MRHVSFEEDINNSTQPFAVPTVEALHQNGILKNTATAGSSAKAQHRRCSLQLVRNEFSNSPLLIKKHQVDNLGQYL